MITNKIRVTAVVCVAALMMTFTVAVSADSRSGPVVHCNSPTTVGAYSRADGASYQRHTFFSTDGQERNYESSSYIHSSDSPFRSASTLWYANTAINTWSNHCAY